ncbi:uncharacterized protein A4U43_C04F35430 [Asparagus officinalis]|uniref:Uncharacterized protein n=1 Tax=Asparagus officinalis TaxID=4686 RepID=A0A5P1F6Q6_ASPOF|nr:uncharacterized protein A4U43_C04F35430 [Asparagus officinalis]
MITKLKEEVGHLQHDILERDDRIRYLSEEEADKRERLNAQECKVEVALACKIGFDFLLGLIPLESRPSPNCLHYPSRVANCLDILKEIEMKGGRLVLDVENGDEGGEESAESFKVDSWVSRPKGDQDKEDALASPQPTPTPEPSSVLRSPTPNPS